MADEGQTVGGRYRIGELIGTGAMGVVWRGRDLVLRREVAIKQLTGTAELTGPDLEHALARARREGRINARLRHPNAVTVFDVVEEDGLPWLVMEYVPSRSLAEILDERGPLPAVRVAQIGVQVAAALAEAHRLGIVHRDVKPSNILLSPDGNAKLADFGISRAFDDGTLTTSGSIAGTPAYLAPEVARGGKPTPEADVFAFGATLYKAVEGRPPFGTDANVLALLRVVATGRVREPTMAGPLTSVLAGLLQREPADRISLARATAALTAVAEPPEEPETERAIEPETEKLAPAPRKRGRLPIPVRSIVVGLLLAVVAGGVLGGMRMMNSPRTPAPTTHPAPPVTTTVTATTPAAPGLPAFLMHYYSLLPGEPTAAFHLLSPRYQAKVGGFGAFSGFYATIASIRVRSVTVTSADTATATLVFNKKNGGGDTEIYRFTFVTRNGALLIDDAELAG